jgi:hypothetical protein
MLADIPQGKRAQQRIADGMDQHVGIAVPHRAPVMRNEHPAQPEGTAFGQLMKVYSGILIL